MRKLYLVFIVLIVLGIATACAGVPTAAPAPQEPAAAEPQQSSGAAAQAEDTRPPVNIYLVAHGACAWDAFWCVVEKGVHDAARDLNVDVTILSPDKFDPEQTAQDIDRALAANPDGLGVTVTDGVLYEEPMMRAINAGVPVIAYNSADWRPKEERIPYLTYIGQDEYLGGYRGADRLVSAHGGTAGVCINQQVGHVGLDARCDGFIDRLAESDIPAEVLSISDDPAESATIIDDYYTAHPDTDLFLTLGPNGANPFYAFMSNAGLEAGDIYHGTFDLSPEIVERIKDGTTDFAIDQQPYLQGYMTVQWLTWINRYALYPASDITPTGPGFVDESTVDLVSELAGEYR